MQPTENVEPVVEVKEGIYYIDGYFVKNPELHLYVGRFTNTVTARIGFEVIEEVITPEQDATLNDNAQGSNNFAAPGAHRYKVSVGLKRLTLNTTDTIKFIELLRLKDGQLLHKVDKTSYAELEKTFARRTFDESGSYEVNKFNLTFCFTNSFDCFSQCFRNQTFVIHSNMNNACLILSKYSESTNV